jgi:hypothetical protein
LQKSSCVFKPFKLLAYKRQAFLLSIRMLSNPLGVAQTPKREEETHADDPAV